MTHAPRPRAMSFRYSITSDGASASGKTSINTSASNTNNNTCSPCESLQALQAESGRGENKSNRGQNSDNIGDEQRSSLQTPMESSYQGPTLALLLEVVLALALVLARAQGQALAGTNDKERGTEKGGERRGGRAHTAGHDGLGVRAGQKPLRTPHQTANSPSGSGATPHRLLRKP
jgi:hypothetical protein